MLLEDITEMKKEFAVIGLGRFGGSICKELSTEGMEVLAIDRDEEKVNEFKNIASYAIVADTTDEDALKEIGIGNFQHVIVAIGENIQASILTTVILVDFGVKEITVKAQNDHHEKILKKIGANRVVHPERDMGKRLAHSMISSNFLDYLYLSDEHSLIEVKASKKMIGKSLADLHIRKKFGCNVIAIRRNNYMNVSPEADEIFEEDDVIILVGSDKDLTRFERHYIID
jgi:trk system potassium uptake protein TrkA